MATKKVSYKNLLKEAISEFDTSKTVDVKGPMLDPILSWDGDGELPIYKDAASILERYYFDDDDDQILVDDLKESEYNEDGTEKKTAAEKDTEGEGTEQAGTSSAGTIAGSKKEIEKDLAEEMEDILAAENEEGISEKEELSEEEDLDESEIDEALADFFAEQELEEGDEEAGESEEEKNAEKIAGGGEEAGGEEAGEEELDVDKGMKESEESVDENEDNTDDIENAIIEKLIDEMELEEEKKASGPMEDAEGAGTEQAGTGDAEGQVPPRKDVHDKLVKPKNYTSEADSAVPGGPSPKKAKNAEDWNDDEGGYNEESEDLDMAFELFKESIKDEE